MHFKIRHNKGPNDHCRRQHGRSREGPEIRIIGSWLKVVGVREIHCHEGRARPDPASEEQPPRNKDSLYRNDLHEHVNWKMGIKTIFKNLPMRLHSHARDWVNRTCSLDYYTIRNRYNERLFTTIGLSSFGRGGRVRPILKGGSYPYYLSVPADRGL